jgi:hypothetical protein
VYWKRQAPRYAYGALLARSVDLYVVFSLILEQSPNEKGRALSGPKRRAMPADCGRRAGWAQ